jgi:hypothetical protein
VSETLIVYDLWCAGYVLASGGQLRRVIPGDWLRFEFENGTGQCSRALCEWGQGALVQARAYSMAIKQLKQYMRTNERIGVRTNDYIAIGNE